MPKIELEISDKALAKWRAFLGTEPAGRLSEAGFLGDWVVEGFLGEVSRYLAQGGPSPKPTEEERRDQKAVLDRRSLSKQQRRVLPMFNENDRITVAEISRMLGEDIGRAAGLVAQWMGQGFLAQGPDSGGEASFVLAVNWQQHNLAANRPSLNAPRAPFMPGKRQGKPREID